MAYYVGLDLGQSADYTALAIVQRAYERDEQGRLVQRLHLRHLERYELRTPYTTIGDAVAAVMRSPALNTDEYDPKRHRISKPKVELLVDKTGVGRAVTDILKARGLRYTGIVIHGGETTHYTDGAYHVPKKDLVGALEVPFDTGRLKIAEGLGLWGVLREELQNFRRKQNPKTSHVSFEHWREGDHDDLVPTLMAENLGVLSDLGSRIYLIVGSTLVLVGTILGLYQVFRAAWRAEGRSITTGFAR